MTLAELIKRATKVGDKFSTYHLPLKMDGKNIDIELESVEDKDFGYAINIKVKEEQQPYWTQTTTTL